MELDEWLALLRLRTLKIKAEITETLHRSPTGSASADVDEFKAGETVVFEVALEGNLFYPLVGYNVDTVSVFRRNGDEVEQVAITFPEDGAGSVTLRWTADRDGRIGQDFYAFVLTKLLPVPELEIGPVTPGGGSVRRTDTPDPDAPPPSYACEPFINSSVSGHWFTTDQYYSVIAGTCEYQLLDCRPALNAISAEAGFSCGYNQIRRLAYIERCGARATDPRRRICFPPD